MLLNIQIILYYIDIFLTLHISQSYNRSSAVSLLKYIYAYNITEYINS